MSIIAVAGRFTRDAEIRYLQDGTAVAGFSIAENIYTGKEQTPQFWECTLWGKRAEALAPYIKKGGAATVFGEPRQEKYTGKDGNEKQTVKIRVNDITLQSSGKDAGSSQGNRPTPPKSQTQPDIDDDVPF